MEFQILGPVRARRDDVVVELGRRRERCLLGVLLLEAGGAVPVPRLIDLLWDGAPPATARESLRAHVSRLRRRLDPDDDGASGARIVSHQGGYRIDLVARDHVDAYRFRALTAKASALPDPAQRATELRRALALWRGPLLEGAAGDRLRERIGTALNEAKLAAAELAVEADLEAGRPGVAIASLTALIDEYPLREGLRGSLMLALYRSGRTAEALEAFRDTRAVFVSELGIEPGAELQTLHERILSQDPGLMSTEAVAGGVGLHRSPPFSALHQLPMDIAEFVGRRSELDTIHAIAEVAESGSTVPAVVTIEGMGGMGKTRLAVRAAHLLAGAGRFTDAQLWADLRGFHPDHAPAEPVVVLENFLRSLGVAAHQLPVDLDGRAALYRDRLAGRRALILLDDAASAEQIRPLLPGTSGTLVLITSRRTFNDLDGSLSLPLGPFTTEEAMTLLGRYLSHARVHAEPDAAHRLAELCGNLPLAVAVSARHLRARPTWPLDEFVTELKPDQHGLDQLSPPARAARSVFDLSYRTLRSPLQRVLRLLAVHPGRDFDACSAAALIDLPQAETRAALDELLDEHLLMSMSPQRCVMHDLIRHYLTDLVDDRDVESERPDALRRLIVYYLTRAQQATLLIHPTESRHVQVASDEPAFWNTASEAVTWIENEYDNLVATVHRAANTDSIDPALALQLVAALYRPLANRGHCTDRIALNELAVRVARRINDRRREAHALEDLGTLCGQVGLLSTSLAYTQQALELWTDLDDPIGQQGCLAVLGNTYRQQGNYDEAVTFLKHSLAIGIESGNRRGEALVLNFLGQTYQHTGDFDAAIASLARSADVYAAIGNRLGEAIALANRGWAHQRAGQPGLAIRYHESSLAIFRTLHDTYNTAEQHWGIAQASHELGDRARARDNWDAAIGLLHDIQALDEKQARHLMEQEVPDTPELIRLNT